jgi:MFS family permease
MNDLRALLGRPAAARMLAAALVGRLPEAMIPLALLLVARAEGGSYGAAGGLAAAFAAGAALGGPVTGRVVDRLGQPMVLLATAVGRSAALAGIALAWPAPRSRRRWRACSSSPGSVRCPARSPRRSRG